MTEVLFEVTPQVSISGDWFPWEAPRSFKYWKEACVYTTQFHKEVPKSLKRRMIVQRLPNGKKYIFEQETASEIVERFMKE